MQPEWREFEQLIAGIEHAVAPSGAVVKSPDRVPDTDTGELREVDASIRYKLGTCPVLITIECRDRVAVEDVRWIEQLAEKRRSIGAAITIAVSSSGFTRPAVQKAAVLGIEIRTLSELSAADLVNWLRFQQLHLDLKEWSLASLYLELYECSDHVRLAPDAEACLRRFGARAQILIRNSDAARFHIENLLNEWTKFNGSFFPEDLPADGTKIRRNLHQTVGPGLLHVETTEGPRDVRVIHTVLELSRTRSMVPASRLVGYNDPEQALVQTAEWPLNANLSIGLHRDLTSGKQA